MKIFFDTEFTGLHKNTTLISIGLIDMNGRSFYAEFSDYDKSQCDEWINENVLSHLIYHPLLGWTKDVAHTQVYGTKEDVAIELKIWLSEYKHLPVNEFVSDVCHYDMVLLIDLFGTAFDFPKHLSPSCHDINQDLANFMDITDREAFDFSRENFLKAHHVKVYGDKHNALYDAKVIREIYNITHSKD